MLAPRHCRPRAYEAFLDGLREMNSPAGLVRAAVAISMHELADADPDAVLARLQAYAAQVRSSVPTRVDRLMGGSTDANDIEPVLAHLHAILFDEEGFRGDRTTYDDPCNSYLPVVLETKRGIPISLTLVYAAVGWQLGLAVRGINAPWHFLAGIEINGSLTLIDVFDSGRLIRADEALARIEAMSGGSIPAPEEVLPTAGPRAWISRMLRNLERLFAEADREKDRVAMVELAEAMARG
ncbi:MAG: hypothetical protein HKN62_08540 [Phycisphaerales bacterium]|nr:hypothetical protein [Phycisphaerales bacterium]